MVKLLRVDERLLHGQVALNWVNNTGASSILIANDDVMVNEMSRMALQLAKPADKKLAIRSIDGAYELLKNPRSADATIFIIVRTVADALRLAKKVNTPDEAGDTNAVNRINKVNIGGIKKKEGSKLIAAAVYLNDAERENLRELKGYVDHIEFRMLPSDSAKSLESVLSKEG